MSSFDPVISPWLAAGSCVGFTCLFVGSLYIFPLRTKQQAREHTARYSLLSSIAQSTPVSASASALAVVAAAAAAASSVATGGGGGGATHQETTPDSPRPSSSSSISTTTLNSTSIVTAGNDVRGSSTTTTTATATVATGGMPKKSQSSGIADNRTHRSSTQLQQTEGGIISLVGGAMGTFSDLSFNSMNGSNSSNGATTTMMIPKKSQSTGLADNRAHRTSTHLQFVETSSSSSSPTSSPAATSVSTFIMSSSSLASSGSLASTRPEVATHSYTSYPTSSGSTTTTTSWSQSEHHQRASQMLQSPATADKKLDRDHPLVIQQRFKGILLTCFVVPLYLWWMFRLTASIPSDLSFWTQLGTFLGLLGISIPENFFKLFNHIIIPLFLVSVLFMGPIFMMFLSNELPFQQAFDWASQRQHLRSLIGMRNLVVGPISEEFIFRACMVAVVANSGASSYAMVFGLPLVFGIAHLNHGYESYIKNGRTPRALLNAALMSIFQFVYTTLFGWFATYLFLRTSNLLGPCLCHTFCNMMGFPDVTNIQYFGRWKNWLYFAFGSGVVLFGLLLRPLTSPGLYGDPATSEYWTITMGPVVTTAS
ncbi:hypothetical protein EDD11_002548 [Mortierella claussenii]|nr:hypothetical protein EDD11_002548 [Mortierella claussenii]